MGRIVYVLRAFPEPSETFVRAELRALDRLGVPLSVVAGWRSDPPAADWGADDEARIPVTILTEQASALVPGTRLAAMLSRDVSGLGPRKAARALRLAALAQAAVPHIPVDAVMLHAHFANDAGALARYLGRLIGVPYRVTAHAYDIFQDPFLLDRNLRFAARILTISKSNQDFLEERIRAREIDGPPVEVVRCGIDLDAFPYRDPGEPHRPARLLCVARLVPKKGCDVLLDALVELRSSGVEATLDFAGHGPAAAELADQAYRAGVSEAVRWLGTRPHDEVRDAIRASDVVVLASRIAADGDRDGVPVSLMEAMALGVPVVSTAVSGIPELIPAGAGRLVPPEDPRALADAVRETLSLPAAKRIARTRAARIQIEGEFDLAKIARSLGA